MTMQSLGVVRERVGGEPRLAFDNGPDWWSGTHAYVRVALPPHIVWHLLKDAEMKERPSCSFEVSLTEEQYDLLVNLPYTDPKSDRLECIIGFEKINSSEGIDGTKWIFTDSFGKGLAQDHDPSLSVSEEKLSVPLLRKAWDAWLKDQSPAPGEADAPKPPGQ